MSIAACSGGAGDILYSIPIMRALGVDTYYIKRNFYHPPHSDLYSTMKLIMEKQNFRVLPTSGDYEWGKYEPGLEYDYNIDSFREQPLRNVIHIMQNMAIKFRVPQRNLFSPWLKVEPELSVPDNIIHLTPRWRDGSKIDWRQVRASMKGTQGFIGFQYEYIDFCQKYGDIQWLPTSNIYEMARFIAGAKRLYCNQSVALVIAQGIGKEYYLEKKPNKYNVVTRLSNEHIL